MLLFCGTTDVPGESAATAGFDGEKHSGASTANTSIKQYTLEQAVEIGLNRSIVLSNARRDREIAETRVRQVRAQVLPHLTASGDYTRLDEVSSMTFDDRDIEMGQLDNYSAGVEARQLLYAGGSVRAALKAAKSYRAISEIDIRRTRQRLTRNIRVAFYAILLARTDVKVQEESLEQLEGLAREAREKYENETASEFDLLSAQVRVANQQPLVIQARNTLDVTKSVFRQLLHLDDELFEVQGSLAFVPADISLEDVRGAARQNRPEIRQQLKRIDLMQADARAEWGTYLPRIYARGAYIGEDPSSAGFGEDGWQWSWNAGLMAEWALLDGGLRRARVMEKRLELAKAQATLQDIELAVDVEVKQYYLDMQNAAEAYEASRDNVTLAEKSLAIAKTRYEAGLSTYLEFTDTNLALSRARLTRATALKRHMEAVAELQYACGLSDHAFRELEGAQAQ
jgi:outer membrane protein TolC